MSQSKMNNKNNSSNTFLLRYVAKNVCNLKSPLLLPLAPLKMFVNYKEPLILLGAWTILIVFWLILWLAAPCNPNLNCIPFDEANAENTKRKDGTKALVVSVICIYAVFLIVTIYAKFFVCMDIQEYFQKTFGGGIGTQVFSLNRKDYLQAIKEENRFTKK